MMKHHTIHRIANKKRYIFAGTALFSILFGLVAGLPFINTFIASAEGTGCNEMNLYCVNEKLAAGTNALKNIPATKIIPPAPEPTAQTNSRAAGGRIVTYSVETRGVITASVGEFKTLANQSLNDSRGWSRLGVQFQEVASGGEFTLVLAEAQEVANFSPGCDSTYSCNVGRYVIINQDRWNGATESWNGAGGSLRDYRHMVVNHETGHWLGHGHASCPGAGQPAPVMQQQSIDLQNCSFNPWPIENELHSTRLGI